jgi:glycosyltransferase involved in cell wall biosynthesis
VTRVSLIIPAYNEELLLGATLRALRDALTALGVQAEFIVVDDGSTDRTAEIARGVGARVVSVHLRHIAAARNAGAKVAAGDVLVFVDADTIVPARVLGAALKALERGAVGGGAGAVQDSDDPRWGAVALVIATWILRRAKWAAGCFFFVRRDVFERVGGFDERYFASEEIHLSRALKRCGRFVMIPDAVITSGRKADTYSFGRMTWQFVRLLDPRALKRRDGLELWYGERGE